MVPDMDARVQLWSSADTIANVLPNIDTITYTSNTAYADVSAAAWEPIWSTSWRVETPTPVLWNTALIPEDEVEIDPDELDSVLEECG